MKAAVIAVVGTLGLLISSTAHANLFTNPGFTTDASGWVVGATGAGCAANFDASVGNPAGSILLNGCGEPASNPVASQTVGGLVPGVQYTIGWETMLHTNFSGPNGASFGVFVDGVVVDTSEFLTSVWTPDSTLFTATLPSHTISFQAELGLSDVSYYLDNVSLLAPPSANVPEPGSLVLLGIAAAAFGLIRRRN